MRRRFVRNRKLVGSSGSELVFWSLSVESGPSTENIGSARIPYLPLPASYQSVQTGSSGGTGGWGPALGLFCVTDGPPPALSPSVFCFCHFFTFLVLVRRDLSSRVRREERRRASSLFSLFLLLLPSPCARPVHILVFNVLL